MDANANSSSSDALALVNGRVVTSAAVRDGYVLVRDGVIAEVGLDGPTPIGRPGIQIIDVGGAFILPGGVDPHVHVGIEFGGQAADESYAECSRSALLGGTTTIVDFAFPDGNANPLDAVRRQITRGADSLVDFAIHGCFRESDRAHLDSLDEIFSLGVGTIKVFTTYRDLLMSDDDTIAAIGQKVAEVGGTIFVHAEDNSCVTAGVAARSRSGRLDPGGFAQSRGIECELQAVNRVIALAQAHHFAAYFVHLSSARAVEAVRLAASAGAPVFSEVCPHYLLLNSEVYGGPQGSLYCCCPPLRDEPVRQDLMEAVVSGYVDVIASDHCAFRVAQKVPPGEVDCRAVPYGLPGVQARVPFMLSELVVRRGVPIREVSMMLSTRPAILNGLYPRKGAVEKGSDADLIVWREDGVRVPDPAEFSQNSDYFPLAGKELWGALEMVIRRGEIAVNRDQMSPGMGGGRFLPWQRHENDRLYELGVPLSHPREG